MGLNIKNERVHSLARQAARLTGRSQTSVIEEALEKLLRELSHAGDVTQQRARIDALLADFDHRLTVEDRSAMSADALYDAGTGLPR